MRGVGVTHAVPYRGVGEPHVTIVAHWGALGGRAGGRRARHPRHPRILGDLGLPVGMATVDGTRRSWTHVRFTPHRPPRLVFRLSVGLRV